MRSVNIYQDTGSALAIVASGCVQTSDADPDITPCGKLFEMSDGSCTYYPVTTAKTEMTLRLECTQPKAEAIRKAARLGELYFEGLRIGDVSGAAGFAYRAFVTGTVKISAKYALCNTYVIELPLRFDASGETLRGEVVST